ncbi:FAD-dependent monooxygenase [Kribbella solani]|uniref:FAD-dependent oxidoreductase n=1 Tax=Kribbella solani TaxID=236067 RepID=UPI0029B1BF97|nr:FAD-dependent monooxygenase [Kribbella solani]MDX3003604.1 FAD-dependent monooxygenase [Kribbella solani]
MQVVVVGGGIGGLALGAGLRRSGYEVTVYDRDTDVTATGGYHITLDQRAQSALGRLVEPETMRRLLASASALRARDRDVFWDYRGRVLGHGPDLSGSSSIDVDRITLRTLLAEAVGEDLRLGQTVASVGTDGRGTPQVSFVDGTSISADLVVGADGTHSIVARHLAGARTNRPVGIIGFSGRTARADLSAAEVDRLGTRSSMGIGPRGAAMYVGFLDPVGNAALDAPELSRSVTTGPTYIWGAMFPESERTASLRDLRGAALQTALVDRFREHRWADHTLEVIARADPGSVAAFRFNAASTRAVDLAPWSAGRITALGDAVHATPPTAGMGAGAAIQDAADLIGQLGTHETISEAVGRYEEQARQRGAEVLTAAMKTVRLILATDGTLGAVATATLSPLLAAGARLRLPTALLGAGHHK